MMVYIYIRMFWHPYMKMWMVLSFYSRKNILRRGLKTHQVYPVTTLNPVLCYVSAE